MHNFLHNIAYKQYWNHVETTHAILIKFRKPGSVLNKN